MLTGLSVASIHGFLYLSNVFALQSCERGLDLFVVAGREVIHRKSQNFGDADGISFLDLSRNWGSIGAAAQILLLCFKLWNWVAFIRQLLA